MATHIEAPRGPSRSGLASVLWPGGDGWLYRLEGATADFINLQTMGRLQQSMQAGKDELQAMKVAVAEIHKLTRLCGRREGRDHFAELLNN